MKVNLGHVSSKFCRQIYWVEDLLMNLHHLMVRMTYSPTSMTSLVLDRLLDQMGNQRIMNRNMPNKSLSPFWKDGIHGPFNKLMFLPMLMMLLMLGWLMLHLLLTVLKT